ncbi:hypothetical protein Agub_g10932, partial [Astrephomene gubernaculifera]
APVPPQPQRAAAAAAAAPAAASVVELESSAVALEVAARFPGRRYFHSRTGVPGCVEDMFGGQDSEDESDDKEWEAAFDHQVRLMGRTQRRMSQRPMGPSERCLMKLWAAFARRRPLYADYVMPRRCLEFVREHCNLFHSSSSSPSPDAKANANPDSDSAGACAGVDSRDLRAALAAHLLLLRQMNLIDPRVILRCLDIADGRIASTAEDDAQFLNPHTTANTTSRRTAATAAAGAAAAASNAAAHTSKGIPSAAGGGRRVKMVGGGSGSMPQEGKTAHGVTVTAAATGSLHDGHDCGVALGVSGGGEERGGGAEEMEVDVVSGALERQGGGRFGRSPEGGGVDDGADCSMDTSEPCKKPAAAAAGQKEEPPVSRSRRGLQGPTAAVRLSAAVEAGAVEAEVETAPAATHAAAGGGVEDTMEVETEAAAASQVQVQVSRPASSHQQRPRKHELQQQQQLPLTQEERQQQDPQHTPQRPTGSRSTPAQCWARNKRARWAGAPPPGTRGSLPQLVLPPQQQQHTSSGSRTAAAAVPGSQTAAGTKPAAVG